MPPEETPAAGGEADGFRPLAHFTAETGWINDPLGLTYHGGRYHLFFQFVPNRVEWNYTCHWGHAVGDDLVSWTQRPTALSPGGDDGGVWSGSIVRESDRARATGAADGAAGETVGTQLYYTSVSAETRGFGRGRVRVATPEDETWEVWHKGAFVADLPDDIEASEFRDPHVLHDGTTWRMILGGGLTDGTAVAWTWTSPDRLTWTYAGELARRSRDERENWTGSVWECPVLIPLDGRWVLVMSVWEEGTPFYVAYGVGDLVDGRFVAQRWGRLSHGPSYYASSTFVDAEGRHGLVHWVREVVDPAGLWAGASSAPQLLHLDGDRLVARPHPVFTGGAIVAEVEAPEPVGVPAASWIEWHSGPGSSLIVADAIALLERGTDDVTLTVDGERHRVPVGDGPVGLLLDRLVIEVFTDAGILAVPLPPIGSPTVALGGAGMATVRLIRDA